MNKIERLFFEQTKAIELPKKNDSILVCLSGGSDSIALLHLLLTIQSPFSLSFGIAHVNHGWRKEKSDIDALFVQNIAKELLLPFFLRTVPSEEWDRIPGTGMEEKGRQVRIRFFKEIMKKEGFNLIALGHTQDDLLETLLFNLIRGISPERFAHLMPAFDPNTSLYRPLLSFSKNALLDYLAEKKINYQSDESNLDESFTRNKIRNQLMPLLQSINPKVGLSLLRFKEILKGDTNFIAETVTEFISKKGRILPEKIQIPRSEYMLLPESLQLYLIRELRKILLNSTIDFYFSQIISIHKGIMNKEDFCYQDKNMGIECKDGWIVFFDRKRRNEQK